jgi:hypothetical protein
MGQMQTSATRQHVINRHSPFTSKGLYPLSRHLYYTNRLQLG